jgi:hypothetical protein
MPALMLHGLVVMTHNEVSQMVAAWNDDGVGFICA